MFKIPTAVFDLAAGGGTASILPLAPPSCPTPTLAGCLASRLRGLWCVGFGNLGRKLPRSPSPPRTAPDKQKDRPTHWRPLCAGCRPACVTGPNAAPRLGLRVL